MNIICVNIHQVLNLPLYFMFPRHYEYLCGLAILEEDAVRANLGDYTGSNSGRFLGHEPCMVEVYVG
jgi:hypothetical protein